MRSLQRLSFVLMMVSCRLMAAESYYTLEDFPKVVKVDAESGKIAPVTVNGEMVLQAAVERKYIFDQYYSQVLNVIGAPAALPRMRSSSG